MIGSCFVVVPLFIVAVGAQSEGETCVLTTSSDKGKCMRIDNCDYAKELLKSRQRPQHCGFDDRTPVVCCPLNTTGISPGQKSEKRCVSYYPKLLNFPFNSLVHFAVHGGKKSSAKEFPHMAILGYGDKDNIQWLCGGSLISEQFVLTAAHCVISKDLGVVRWVRLGDLDIKVDTDDARLQQFNVTTTFIHPDYKSSSHYHDVAVIKLDREAELNVYVLPACLYGYKNISDQLIATGWGKLEYLGESSSHLMKVNLNHVDNAQCARSYLDVSKKKLANGIVDDLQICAGTADGKDTCPGDSGGPLQFKAHDARIYYYIVGVTSFGKACGIDNSAGVYTRVAGYIDWIHDIVWPLE